MPETPSTVIQTTVPTLVSCVGNGENGANWRAESGGFVADINGLGPQPRLPGDGPVMCGTNDVRALVASGSFSCPSGYVPESIAVTVEDFTTEVQGESTVGIAEAYRGGPGNTTIERCLGGTGDVVFTGTLAAWGMVGANLSSSWGVLVRALSETVYRNTIALGRVKHIAVTYGLES